MLSFEKIAVKKLTVFLGVDQRGQIMGQPHTASEDKKLFVIPGQLAIIEITTPNGKVVHESPLGQFGWEYTLFEETRQ